MALTASACFVCRQWMVRTFIASAGHGGTLARSPQSPRFLATSTRRVQEADEKSSRLPPTEHALNDITVEYAARDNPSRPDVQRYEADMTTQPPADCQKSPNSHIPWYLQVQQTTEVQDSVLSARQRIPDLPAHPPALLQPLLSRVSVELGMDDLSLLDLRAIDPPPALGANLLMIVATARSEKHLHVSADKLCRWLRSEHGLTPYADGLLGRAELKLKVRRRARRTRLLSSVGAKQTADTELDEGIRTGWVCVNVGKVEGGELPKSAQELEREREIVGFGSRTSGCRIVVQLVTEDKRGEIELEKLWLAVLKKSTRAKEALEAEEEDPTLLSLGKRARGIPLSSQDEYNTFSDVGPTDDDAPGRFQTATV